VFTATATTTTTSAAAAFTASTAPGGGAWPLNSDEENHFISRFLIPFQPSSSFLTYPYCPTQPLRAAVLPL